MKKYNLLITAYSLTQKINKNLPQSLSSLRLLLIALFLAAFSSSSILHGQSQPNLKVWDSVRNQAKGQTVYFSAWGGSESINAYIRWAADEIEKEYGVLLKHVKVSDIASVAAQVLSEKQAGKNSGGNSDMLWINGENFKTMKKNNLLYGPFTNALPNSILVAKKDIFANDFQEPIDGLEQPWGMAQLVFIADTKRARKTMNILDLLRLSEEKPGIFTYPKPPNFHGTTFLKQVLLELSDNRKIFKLPPKTKRLFDKISAPLWQYLDALHPNLWRKGESFPQNLAAQQQLLDEGEIAISLSFNPNEALRRVLAGEFPDSVITYTHLSGTLANAHYLAIPFNSDSKAGALIAINFLSSPKAQARKNDLRFWGDPSVLDLEKLNDQQKAFFKTPTKAKAAPDPQDLKRSFAEPDSGWVELLEKEWARRYGS